MQIKELKDSYPLVYEAALHEQERAGNSKNDSRYIRDGKIDGNFLWVDSIHGAKFWDFICMRYFKDAQKLHPELFGEPSSGDIPNRWKVVCTKRVAEAYNKAVNYSTYWNKSRNKSHFKYLKSHNNRGEYVVDYVESSKEAYGSFSSNSVDTLPLITEEQFLSLIKVKKPSKVVESKDITMKKRLDKVVEKLQVGTIYSSELSIFKFEEAIDKGTYYMIKGKIVWFRGRETAHTTTSFSNSNQLLDCIEATPEQIEEFHSFYPEETTSFQSMLGISVGDSLNHKILDAWCGAGYNRLQKDRGRWEQNKAANFCTNRKITNIENIAGVWAGLVSGTHKVYIRLEGLAEFMESYDTSFPKLGSSSYEDLFEMEEVRPKKTEVELVRKSTKKKMSTDVKTFY